MPDELNRSKDAFKGGTLTGNICWAVATTDAMPLIMYGEQSFSVDNTRVWFSLKPK